jgi:hypothetical protein
MIPVLIHWLQESLIGRRLMSVEGLILCLLFPQVKEVSLEDIIFYKKHKRELPMLRLVQVRLVRFPKDRNARDELYQHIHGLALQTVIG